MTIAHAQLQGDLDRIQASFESHQRGMEEAKDAQTKATEALADDSVLVQVKAELSHKEQLLTQAMTDIQGTAQIEEKLRDREEEIEKVRAEHHRELAALRKQLSGTEEEINVSCAAPVE